MRKTLLNLIICAVLIICFSCGKKTDVKPKTTSTPPPVTSVASIEKITSQFVDSPVYGLNILGDDGVLKETDHEGKFECNKGEIIKFFIAERLYIGESTCNEKIFIDQLGSNDSEVTNRLSALLLKLNINADESLIDISGLSSYQTPTDLQLLFASKATDSSLIGKIDSVISLIKNSDQTTIFGNESNLTILKNAAKEHMSKSVAKYSSIKPSETDKIGTLSNWLNTKSSSLTTIDLSYGNVFPTVVTPGSGDYCPAGLGAIGVSLFSENINSEKKYYLNTVGYINGLKGELSRTRILTERATNIFTIRYGSDLTLKGTISLLLNASSQSLSGTIKLNYLRNDYSVRAHCEYLIDF